jgi:hypothetical protein
MEQRKRKGRAKLKWLRGAVKESLNQVGKGRGAEFRSLEELDRRLDQLGQEAAAELAKKRCAATKLS